jgi:choice-of-anchor A domain-containing protein
MITQINRFSCVSTAAIALALSGFFPSPANAAFVDLGEAGGYAAFILPGGSIDMTINGGAAVNGDVAASAGTHIDLGSGAKVGVTADTGDVVSGKIYLDTISNPQNPATVKLDNQNPNSVVNRDLSQAVQDAVAANHFAAGLTATKTLGTLDVTSQYTLVGNGGLNVISLTDVKLHGDGLLTLQGSASDFFVLNLTGTYTQSSKSNVQLSGGLLAQNVLWNFIGSGNGANIGTGSNGVTFGTFLAPDRDFSITDTILYGSVISAGHLAIGSKALVVQPIPEVAPSSVIFGFLGLVVAVSSRRALAGRARVLASRDGRK